MKTRILVYTASAILGIGAIFAIIVSTQEPVITTVNVDILPGTANPEQEENLSPKVIKVVIGVNNTIRWNNLDDVPRTLTPDYKYDGFSKSIGILKPGESEERTFEKPGVYDYHGEPGPWIKGTIIVIDSKSPPTKTDEKFEITGIEYAVKPNDPLLISVIKTGYDMCDSWDAQIISASNNSTVWQREYHGSCATIAPPKEQKFEYKISDENRPIIISEIGDYVFQITIDDTYLEKKFIVRQTSTNPSLDKTEYPIAEHDYDPYNMRCGSGVVILIPENWQSLGMKPPDEDWKSLGRYLINQAFYQELKNRNIIFEPACFGVYAGPVEDSYPPRFAMCTAVTASNGTKLYLEGTVHEFDVIYFHIDNKIPYSCTESASGCLCGIENKN